MPVERLSWAERAEIQIVEGGFVCFVWVMAGFEGWRFRTRKWFFNMGEEPRYSREEALTLAMWDALDLCERMGWKPNKPRWQTAMLENERRRNVRTRNKLAQG